jgi:general secretion pathway protein B
MSYILDALRRSQVDRERGQVPGLHAQPTLGTTLAPMRPRMDPMALLVAVAALLLTAVLLAWWLRRDGASSTPVVPAATPAPATLPLPTPVPVPVPAPAPQAPLPMVVSAPAPTAAPIAAAPVPPPGSPPLAGAAAANKPSPAQPPPSATAAAKPSSVAPALVVLNAEQRRDLPPLLVGGSVFSETPSSRFVIVNGQLVREGESAAPGVLVERIGPKALVLRWRELRFEWPL